MKQCAVEGCRRGVKHRAWCGAHYQRWVKYGDPLKLSAVRSWDGRCRICRKPGPFYGHSHVCSKCRTKRSNRWRAKNLTKVRSYQSKRRKRLSKERRDAVLDHYGRVCACPGCGENIEEFLTIDHVNGGGNKHRKEIGGSANFYRWLIANDFPTGFQTLCFNCNYAKSHAPGGCPHTRGVRTALWRTT